MMQLDAIRNFFPADIRERAPLQKYLLKEYIQLLILDFLSTTPFIKKIAFIGGTNLRLVKGIDRFSEDLDFDCKDLSKEEFMAMTDAVLNFLKRDFEHLLFNKGKSERILSFGEFIQDLK
jgi:hypothetical protein